MKRELDEAREALRLLCNLHEQGTPIMMSATQLVDEHGRTILAALDAQQEREAAARREALEEAALECSRRASDWNSNGNFALRKGRGADAKKCKALAAHLRECAAAIRALADKERGK